MRRKVDLPEPDFPRIATISPSRKREVETVENEPADMVRHAIGLGNGLGAQQRYRHLSSLFSRGAGARRRGCKGGATTAD